MNDAQIARQWAEGFIKHADSAQIVDADALTAARHILATTTPPTMDDIAWDDEVHVGLCASVPGGSLVRMVCLAGETGAVHVIADSVQPSARRLSELTPIPGTKIDLTPRRTHADTVTAASIEDYKAGRVVDFDDKTLLPRPEDVPAGDPWMVLSEGREAIGYRNDPGGSIPWVITYQDCLEFEYCYDSDITLVSRMAPESTPDHPTVLTTEEDYENAPVGTIAADGDAAAVKVSDGTWRWTGSELSYRSDDLCYGESDSMTVVRWGK